VNIGLHKRAAADRQAVAACTDGDLEEQTPAAVGDLEGEAVHNALRFGSKFTPGPQDLQQSGMKAGEVGSLTILKQHVMAPQVKKVDAHRGSPSSKRQRGPSAEHTVRVRLAAIFRTLGISNRGGAVLAGLEHGNRRRADEPS
jgi:hypothetical protein